MGQHQLGEGKSIFQRFTCLSYLSLLLQAGSKKKITNFGSDVKNSEVYFELIYQVAPKDVGVSKDAMNTQDLTERAEKMLNEAKKINCRAFVTAKDVVSGNEKLNLAFVVNLYNNFSKQTESSGSTAPAAAATQKTASV